MSNYPRRDFRFTGRRPFRAPPSPWAPPAAPNTNMPLLPALPRDYAVFDLETTGFSPQRDEITEVGWLVVRDGIASEPRSALCAIRGTVPAEVETLTGISTKMLREGGLDPYNVLSLFYDDIGDLPLVGHNAVRFDCPFVEATCTRVGLVAPDRRRYHDTAAIYKGARLGMSYKTTRAGSHFEYSQLVLGTPSRLKYNLAVCCASYGLQADDVSAHRAGGDVLLTHRLYQAMLSEYEGPVPADQERLL